MSKSSRFFEAPAAAPRRRLTLLLAATAVALIGVSLYLFSFWRETTRPGARYYHQGMDLLAAGQTGEALNAWRRGFDADPGDPRCPEMLGDFAIQARQPDRAVEFYQACLKAGARHGELRLKYSRVLNAVGKSDEALSNAEQAVKLLPRNGEAFGHYGLLLTKAKKRPEATAALRKAHQLEPENRLYHLGLVEVLMDTLQMAEAERYLEAFLAKNPEDPEACFKMAVIYNQKPRNPENLNQAIRYAEKAMPAMPREARGYSVLGQLYLDAGRVKDALQLYKIGRQFVPNAESILRGLADCYTRLGRTRELAEVSAEFRKVLARHDRIDHLKHVMGFNSKDVVSGLELARLTEEEGLLVEAQQYYEQLVRQAPQDRRTRVALAGFYRRIRQPELAARALRPDFVP